MIHKEPTPRETALELADLRSLMLERFTSAREYVDLTQRLVEQRFTSIQEAAAAALLATERALAAALLATEKAIIKADAANEKRFDGVNEFRGALSDQQATLVSRAEANAQHQSIEIVCNALRIDLTTVKDDLKKEISDLRESRSRVQGAFGGLDKALGYLIGVIGVVLAAVEYLKR